MVLGAKCVWISYEGCKSFSFYNPARESPPHIRLSIFLSLFLSRFLMKRWIARVYGGWSAAEYSDAPRGLVYGNMEGFQGRNSWRENEDEKYGARGYGRQPEDDSREICSLRRLFSLAFSRSFAFSSPKGISIISHPLSRGNVASLLANHFTKWDSRALMRHRYDTFFFCSLVSRNMLRTMLGELNRRSKIHRVYRSWREWSRSPGHRFYHASFRPRMRMHFSLSWLSLFSLGVNSVFFPSSLWKVFQVRNFRKSLILKLYYAMQI